MRIFFHISRTIGLIGILSLGSAAQAHFGMVEVEHYNRDQRAQGPTATMPTQTIEADQNGVFSYAAPHPGWWEFAALHTAAFKRKHDGQEKDVELGAVIWAKFEAWQER